MEGRLGALRGPWERAGRPLKQNGAVLFQCWSGRSAAAYRETANSAPHRLGVYSVPYAVVSKKEADKDPFPYVYVNNDATYRELTEDEKEYLQELFDGADGGRPYVKTRFWQLTPDKKLHGFLARKRLPRGLEERIPAERSPWWKFW